ncbi:hypothetical protein LUZ62_038251 [Rhynchospora pubera]|uniref:NAC domain-containing protein n=1 Tax=Rhynchospora pubera TaxID=906938 RepID=A0AAV8F5W4_9POAL|nr:hypothetical protein LUZ62_038251 [Rhynchospora pubera]
MLGPSWFEMPVAKNEENYLYLPPGFRFHPTDDEIIDKYLFEKVANPRFTTRAIGDVDLNKCEPWDLPSKAKMGEKEWYFFCQKDKKYPTGMRTNRATKSGYWKATGKDKEIYSYRAFGNAKKRVLVGMKKTLVFYMGRAPKGEKTNWVMHEFRLEGKSKDSDFKIPAKDEWVVCRVYEKKNPSRRNQPNETDLSNSYDDQDFMDLLVDPTYYNSNNMPSSIAGASVEASNTRTMPTISNFSGMMGLTNQSSQVQLPNSFSSNNHVPQTWVDIHGYANLIQGQEMANSMVLPRNNIGSYQ